MKAALVGSGIGQSLTPGMHEDEGRAQGLNYRYDRFDTALAPWKGMSLAEIVDQAEAQGFAGLNFTHPHKMQIARHVHELSEASKALGTVNTVVFRDGRRIGQTTDYSGFAAALRAFEVQIEGAEIVQFGAGGAGAATALALLDGGARLCVADVDEARAEGLVNRLLAARPRAHVRTGPIDMSQAAGAVNATPLGMDAYPGMAFDPRELGAESWVADIVYFPLETALTKAARARGLRVMNGGAMALHQAVAAFELITGIKADVARMDASFNRLLAAREAHGAKAS